jgi:hypothetical protein
LASGSLELDGEQTQVGELLEVKGGHRSRHPEALSGLVPPHRLGLGRHEEVDGAPQGLGEGRDRRQPGGLGLQRANPET